MVVYGQELIRPVQVFAEVCLQQKEAMLTPTPNYSRQYLQLFDCLKQYTTIPIQPGQALLHPTFVYSEEEMNKHLLFSPDYIGDYMLGKIPDPYTHSFPYNVAIDESFRQVEEQARAVTTETKDTMIYYCNTIAEAQIFNGFDYRVIPGAQQVVVIAEDDTPLEVQINSKAGEAVLFTDPTSGIVQRVWNEDEQGIVSVKVLNHTDKDVAFVIAVY